MGQHHGTRRCGLSPALPARRLTPRRHHARRHVMALPGGGRRADGERGERPRDAPPRGTGVDIRVSGTGPAGQAMSSPRKRGGNRRFRVLCAALLTRIGGSPPQWRAGAAAVTSRGTPARIPRRGRGEATGGNTRVGRTAARSVKYLKPRIHPSHPTMSATATHSPPLATPCRPGARRLATISAWTRSS